MTTWPDDKKTDNIVEEKINNSTLDNKKSNDRKKVGKRVNNKFIVIIYIIKIRYL